MTTLIPRRKILVYYQSEDHTLSCQSASPPCQQPMRVDAFLYTSFQKFETHLRRHHKEHWNQQHLSLTEKEYQSQFPPRVRESCHWYIYAKKGNIKKVKTSCNNASLDDATQKKFDEEFDLSDTEEIKDTRKRNTIAQPPSPSAPFFTKATMPEPLIQLKLRNKSPIRDLSKTVKAIPPPPPLRWKRKSNISDLIVPDSDVDD